MGADVKEVLQKLYQVEVEKVWTQNRDGMWVSGWVGGGHCM